MPAYILYQLAARSKLCRAQFQVRVKCRWTKNSSAWRDCSMWSELSRFVLSVKWKSRWTWNVTASLRLHPHVSQIDFLCPSFVVQIAFFLSFTHVDPIMQSHDASIFHLGQENMLEPATSNLSHATRVQIKPNRLQQLTLGLRVRRYDSLLCQKAHGMSVKWRKMTVKWRFHARWWCEFRPHNCCGHYGFNEVVLLLTLDGRDVFVNKGILLVIVIHRLHLLNRAQRQ